VKIRYLLDENLDPRFLRTLQRHYPQIDVLRVGDAGAPGLGVSDPVILHMWRRTSRILVTDNRKSMPAMSRRTGGPGDITGASSS
jgi:predicted nuclease of predicted toxin-antitoxin system